MNRVLAVAIVAGLAACAAPRQELQGPPAASLAGTGPSESWPRPSEDPAPPSPAESRLWTNEEMAILDRGLDVLNCTRTDLGFQKRPIEDPFRLAVVNRALDDPLSVGDEAQAWDDAVKSASIGVIVRAAFRALESSHPDTTVSTVVSNPTMPDLESRLPLGDHLLPAFVKAFRDEEREVERRLAILGDDRDRVLRGLLLSQVEKPAWRIIGRDVPQEELLRLSQGRDAVATDGCGRSALWFARSVEEMCRSLQETAMPEESRWQGRFRFELMGGVGVLYGYGDDVHETDEDAVLVLDLGGNDTWTRGASASVLKGRPVSICIDLAGNDRYVGREDLSFGGALGGVAIQWDCAGDDLYDAGHASLGAGICGVGILVDEGGDDVYRAKDFCIGAGAFGVGILLDKSGNDLYHGDLYAEGFASTRGCGVLADLDGNDVYDAGGVHLHAPLYTDRHQSLSQGFSIGMRPDASGGVGVLVDVRGNDRYTADIYGQGASYWFSLGILVDDDGNDTYNLGQYGQRSGIHLSAGILLDRAGSDLYYLKNGVGMGGAHDYAVGMLVDRGGDDYYAGSGGTQGGALTNSVALLFDMGGNDGYAAVNEGAQGYASPARGTGGIGLLMDAGGKDVYTERERDGTAWTKELLGAGLDEPEAAAAAGSGDPGVATITPEKAKEAVDRDVTVLGDDGHFEDDLDRLWKLASEWEVGDNRVIVPIARERLVALGRPALDRALERVGDRQGLEYRNCELVFAKFPAEEVVPRLIERTRDADMFVRRNSVRALASLQAKGALDRLAEMLEKDPETRGTVLGALAAMKTVLPSVKGYLRDPKETVGVQAVLCLAGIADGPAVEALCGALGPDHSLPVRLAAMDRLAAMGDGALVPLTLLVEEEERPVAQRRNALRTLGRTKSAGAVHPVVEALRAADRGIRLAAYQAAGDLARALGAEDAKAVAEAVAAARAREADDLLKRMR